ncbi:hypothetical protein [Flavobacterium cerinum]|uniref:DUF485 domain-containing protein n=1 Tax=Flavobacterium cerinum TaxID=2502784 RepID=A0ABY5IWM9_9FLAO|nr:hypothetical protein [Flavobacterium cerinum]UUC45861.1 hypothetical protein NOX80_01345 [Flavobacterium cerinum]
MPSDLSTNLNYIHSESENTDSDHKSKKEEQIFEKQKNYIRYTFNDLKNKRYSTNTKLRIYLAIWSSFIVTYWLWKVGEILINNNDRYCLSDTVLNVLLGTATLNVLGIVAIAMYDLFNGKSEDKIQ